MVWNDGEDGTKFNYEKSITIPELIIINKYIEKTVTRDNKSLKDSFIILEYPIIQIFRDKSPVINPWINKNKE